MNGRVASTLHYMHMNALHILSVNFLQLTVNLCSANSNQQATLQLSEYLHQSMP